MKSRTSEGSRLAPDHVEAPMHESRRKAGMILRHDQPAALCRLVGKPSRC